MHYDVRRLPFDDFDHRGDVPDSPLVSTSARRGDGLTAVPAPVARATPASYVSRVRSCMTGAWGPVLPVQVLYRLAIRLANLQLPSPAPRCDPH